jgi:hypothetical protein
VRREVPSHIIGVAIDDPSAVLLRLASRQVKAAVRDGLLRIVFRAFNNEADVDAAIRIISDPAA